MELLKNRNNSHFANFLTYVCVHYNSVVFSPYFQKEAEFSRRNPIVISYHKYSDHYIQNFKETLKTYDVNDIISTVNSNQTLTQFHTVLIELFEVKNL